MTIINQRDLDKQMSRHIDPRSVPKHVGGSQGAMEANFVAQSDTQITDSGSGRRGAAEANRQGMPDDRFYGSSTIISVNDAPPLLPQMEPPVPVVAPVPAVDPQRPRTVAELLASMRPR